MASGTETSEKDVLVVCGTVYMMADVRKELGFDEPRVRNSPWFHFAFALFPWPRFVVLKRSSPPPVRNNINEFRRCHPICKKVRARCGSPPHKWFLLGCSSTFMRPAHLSCDQLTFHATRRTPHNASRLMHVVICLVVENSICSVPAL